ncbi:hypothetical protein N1851_013937 [Merluccius polli]|uniref:Uncharacterized protein n=1 Tax=Merluccius polli TaxID=89951 RepID=A0AA47MV50_MERPO|nr:hypothetical protein N1851_013937 [Merluccius polli]
MWGGVVHQPQGGAVERARESRASSVLDPGEPDPSTRVGDGARAGPAATRRCWQRWRRRDQAVLSRQQLAALQGQAERPPERNVTLALSENAFSLLAFCPSRESIDRKDMAASIELARPMYILISDSSLRRIIACWTQGNRTRAHGSATEPELGPRRHREDDNRPRKTSRGPQLKTATDDKSWKTRTKYQDGKSAEEKQKKRLPQNSLKPLQMIQNSAARVLTKTKRRDHITLILKSLHWLPISHRIDFSLSLKWVGPNYLHDMFKWYSQTRTKQGEAAISHYGVHLYNQLLETIKNATTIAIFKTKVKTKLFLDAFCNTFVNRWLAVQRWLVHRLGVWGLYVFVSCLAVTGSTERSLRLIKSWAGDFSLVLLTGTLLTSVCTCASNPSVILLSWCCIDFRDRVSATGLFDVFANVLRREPVYEEFLFLLVARFHHGVYGFVVARRSSL